MSTKTYQRLNAAATKANMSGIVMNGILSRTIPTINDNDLPNSYFAKRGRVLLVPRPRNICNRWRQSSTATSDSYRAFSDIEALLNTSDP